MPDVLVITSVAVPMIVAFALGFMLWWQVGLQERTFASLTAIAFIVAGLSTAVLVGLHLAGQVHEPTIVVARWFGLADYHFELALVIDGLSLTFASFVALLVGMIGVFSRRYLHREPGYFRFYLLLTMFGAGVLLIVFAGSLDMIFIGWEFVGLTSTLLIAFFHERQNPVDHGTLAFITYRCCDIGLLVAVIWMHHRLGSAAIEPAVGDAFWGGLKAAADPQDATMIGLLLLFASMGKSAQVPLGGWLPRAMEGPTPSSAIFYGAISIHLGPYLLLRAAPLLEQSPTARTATIVVGALTALHATYVGRVQTDIKSVLAYASMAQVGIIFVEIGFGCERLALLHIVGHAASRSLQILRSPSLLHDHHHLEQAVGGLLPRTGLHIERIVPDAWQPWLYRHALERGYFETIVRERIVGPIVAVSLGLDDLDRRWTRWLAGVAGEGDGEGRAGDEPTPAEKSGAHR